MSTKVLLTSTNFVRTQTAISDNVTDKLILPAIRETQDINLREILGSNLLNKLCELVVSGKIEFPQNSKYKELLDIGQYYICYQSISNLVVSSTYKINNLGIHQNNDEYTQVPYMSEVFRLKDWWVSRADHYCLLMQQFILRNIKDFPELDGDDYNRIHSHLYSSASCGINLGGERGVKYYNKYKPCWP